MEERWVVVRKGADFNEIAKKFHVSPMIARLMRNREVVGDACIEEYLNGTLDKLEDPMLMKDMDVAIDIIREKIHDNQRIRVIGDYDIDGVNATYILLEGLRKVGAKVDSDIPDRMKDGYGLSIELIERAIADGIDTIITCDNGIAARQEVAYAKEMGVTVIITDHHEVPYEEIANQDVFEKKYLYPVADAIVNPKREDCNYPFKKLCGAAVAYKLVEALLQSEGKDSEDLDYLIENVAIATIGDVMDLIGENRIFVKQGLEMLKRTKNLGLQSLIEVTGVEKDMLGSYHIGFVIGPCLNASGRLDTARRALELLEAKTKKDADILAGDLKALNDSRKDLTVVGVEQAIEVVEKGMLNDRVLVIYLPDCHESLAGIIAGRIRERYYKPTFVLTEGKDGAKGSGRSTENYNMYEELNKCKELLVKYGGHKLAAGLSLKKEDIDRFRATLNQLCTLTKEEQTKKIAIDMQLPLSYVSQEFIQELSILEPFGKGNEKPVFAEKNLEVVKYQVVGKAKNVIKMTLKDDSGLTMDAVCFNDKEKLENLVQESYGKMAVENMKNGRRSGVRLSFTYYPSINEYMGVKNVQIIVQNFK